MHNVIKREWRDGAATASLCQHSDIIANQIQSFVIRCSSPLQLGLPPDMSISEPRHMLAEPAARGTDKMAPSLLNSSAINKMTRTVH